MAARSVWSGLVSFGLVSIPVKLYTATDSDSGGVTFHQVRRTDGSRIQYRRIAAADGREVPYSEITKGIEFGDQVVVLTDEELEALPLPTVKQVEVLHFCQASEIDAALPDKAYHVTPGSDAAARAYALLAATLDGQVAVGRIAIRARERLCTLSVRDGVIVLTTLLWPSQLRQAPEVKLPEVTEQELTLARALVAAMTAPFDPAEHHDRYAEAVTALAAAKAAGLVPAQETVPGPAQATDLMSVLTAAVEAAKALKAA